MSSAHPHIIFSLGSSLMLATHLYPGHSSGHLYLQVSRLILWTSDDNAWCC